MTDTEPKKVTGNIIALSAFVMLATIMQTLDMTIANVALPHMQNSMSAAQDQITWVLTSYVVASAIGMSLTGYFVARFGRRRVFVYAVVGFTLASMLCGMAANFEQLVAFRMLQGMMGAALLPISQAILSEHSAGVDPDTRRRILRDNTIELYDEIREVERTTIQGDYGMGRVLQDA